MLTTYRTHNIDLRVQIVFRPLTKNNEIPKERSQRGGKGHNIEGFHPPKTSAHLKYRNSGFRTGNIYMFFRGGRKSIKIIVVVSLKFGKRKSEIS